MAEESPEEKGPMEVGFESGDSIESEGVIKANQDGAEQE